MNGDRNNSIYDFKQQLVEVPQYGVKLKFNHVFPEKRTQNVRPTFRQSLPLIPLAYRLVGIFIYILYFIFLLGQLNY